MTEWLLVIVTNRHHQNVKSIRGHDVIQQFESMRCKKSI